MGLADVLLDGDESAFDHQPSWERDSEVVVGHRLYRHHASSVSGSRGMYWLNGLKSWRHLHHRIRRLLTCDHLPQL
jgi:hypothetical protein